MRGLCCLCLWILIRVSSSTSTVTGLIGHNVTLTCRYDAKTHGVLSFCWGKERVPTSKCSNTILSSTGEAVLYRRSPGYQLLGPVKDGDLSLTILNAQREDAGVYGCRVEIPGWFNDIKVNIQLIIEAALEQPVTQNYIISTAGTTGVTEILTASASKSVEVGHQQMDLNVLQSQTDEVNFFSSIGNIGRMAGLLLLTIIIILCFIFRRMFLKKEALKHHSSITAEDIYESIAMT